MRCHAFALENRLPTVGLAAIETYEPPCKIPNAWFEASLRRKFVKHTGIVSRNVWHKSEVALAAECTHKLAKLFPLDLKDCAGLVLVSPSLIPVSVVHRYADHARARREQPNRVALQLAAELGIRPRKILGINGFCSGYAKAFAQVTRRLLPSMVLGTREYILVVTSSCISRITDFDCEQAGALFGDFATVSVISRADSLKYPIEFELLGASYQKTAANSSYFDFSQREDVLGPTEDSGRGRAARKVVFSLDGMGIADTAPRAMASAASELVKSLGLTPSDVDTIVPHQAGTAIVRLTGMKLEELGFQCPIVNGMTREIGNISSGSVPYAIKSMWSQLAGNILCPVAAVGAPGKKEVSQGCIAIKARRETIARAA